MLKLELVISQCFLSFIYILDVSEDVTVSGVIMT